MKINAQDQVDQGAFGRPLTPGTYPATILESSTHVSDRGNSCIKATIVVEAPESAAPEGLPKMDYYVTPGQFSMKNLIDEFFPEAKGKGEFELPVASLAGRRIRVVSRIRPAKLNPDGSTKWAAKADVAKLLKKEPNDPRVDLVIAPKAEDAAENDPF